MDMEEDLAAKFESLCDEQEALYKPEFEEVFKVLFAIDRQSKDIISTKGWDMANPIPDIDKALLDEALNKAGYGANEAFCKAFIRYVEITITGKRLQRKTVLNEAERITQGWETQSKEPDQQESGWRFVSTGIYVPECARDVVIDQMEADALSGKGLYENITGVPLEDEEEDDFMMVEVYGCKASILPYLDELKKFGVIARKDNYGLISGEVKKLFLGYLKELITYIKDNTDKPMKVRNVITGAITGIDDLPVWGLILQILTLQGLCRWLESVDINKGDSGFEEVQSLWDWLLQFLIVKLFRFCKLPLSAGDKQTLKPMTDYLLSTDVGKAVQDYLKQRQTGQQQKDQLTDRIKLYPDIDLPESPAAYILAQMEADALSGKGLFEDGLFQQQPKTKPEEQQQTGQEKKDQLTDREKHYYQKAVEAGCMERTDTGYKWKESKARLAYFVQKIFSPRGTGVIPFKRLEALFGVKHLAQSLNNVNNTKYEQKWKKDIDEMMGD